MKKPLFFDETTRAARTITKLKEERKGETAKKAGKMRFFSGHVQNVQESCGLEGFADVENCAQACAMLFHSRIDEENPL